MNARTKMLVVDDDVKFTETLKDLLEEKCYDASAVYNGYEALERIKKEKFDIVLMDIKMPVMNGIEALREINKMILRPVVILMTGFTLEDLIKEALQEGAFAVLYKPLDIPELLQRLDMAKGVVLRGASGE